MKKSDELRRRTRKLIAKNLIILVALVVVAFVGAYSWFKAEPNAHTNSLSIKATAPNGLEYFIVAPSDKTVAAGYNEINTWISTYNTAHQLETGFQEKSWHQGNLTLDFSDAEFGFLSDLFLCETTSNGAAFKIPKLIQYGDIAYVDPEGDFDDAVANENYLSFDIYFRSKTVNDVKLLHTSSLAPAAEPSNANEESMKNAAIGAVRMAIFNGNERELLWIPAPCIWYEGTNADTLHLNYTGSTAGTFKPGGNVTVSGDTVSLTGDATNEHWYYNTSKVRVKDSGTDLIASTAGDYQLGATSTDDLPVVVMDNYNSTDGYYYNRIRLNMWIEGEDAESRLKFVGGKFNMVLNFDVDD